MSTETLSQKEKRLKSRKAVYTESFNKGLFMIDNKRLCEWIMQPDVLIRIHKAGMLDDDTGFNNITIEGFKP